MLDIVFNPKAAKGKSSKSLKIIKEKLDSLKVDYSVHYSEAPKHAIFLTEELIKNGATTIIAMGGDGTVNEVLNGFSLFDKVNLGIIPCGTGNDFVSCIDIPLEPLKALDLILNGKAKYTDYMQMTGVRGINIIGTGIDVDVLKRCRQGKFFNGKVKYLLSLVVSLIKFKNYNLNLKYNGKDVSRKSLIACVGNGRVFGGGIKVCPEAIADDGKLDLVNAHDIKRSKIPGAFIKLMKKGVLRESFTDFELVEEIEVLSDKPFTVNVDGELYDDLPFKVKVAHNQLKIYRP